MGRESKPVEYMTKSNQTVTGVKSKALNEMVDNDGHWNRTWLIRLSEMVTCKLST